MLKLKVLGGTQEGSQKCYARPDPSSFGELAVSFAIFFNFLIFFLKKLQNFSRDHLEPPHPHQNGAKCIAKTKKM